MRRVFWSTALSICVALSATTACKGKDDKKESADKDGEKAGDKTPATDKKAAAGPSGDAVAKRYLECIEIARDKKYEDMLTCYTEDATSVQVGFLPPVESKGRDAIIKDVKDNQEALPDSGYNMRLLLVKDDKELVSVGLTYARQEGEDGEELVKVGIMSANHSTVDKNGAVESERVFMDQSSLLGQLGQMPEGVPFRPAQDPDPAPPVVVVAEGSETEAKNLALVKQVYEAMNKHDAAAVMASYADDIQFRYMASPEDVSGKETVQKQLAEYFAMATKASFEIDWIFAAGDYVVAQSTGSGKNDGPLPGGMEATGENFETVQLDVYRIRGDKISEQMSFTNGYAFAAQLGLVPDPSEGDMLDEEEEEDK